MPSKISSIEKPKSKAHKRFLENRAPKLVENDKKCLFLRGGNTSQTITNVMKFLFKFKKSNSIQFHQRNILRPFEDISSLEFFSQKNDTSQFIFGSHNKKRPNNLIFGRLFDNQFLDMIELGVLDVNLPQKLNISGDSKPIVSFTGSGWTENKSLERSRNILTDLFAGATASRVLLTGFEICLNFEILNNLQEIKLNVYKINLKSSGTKFPRIELEDLNLNILFAIRRSNLGSSDLYKKSLKKPKQSSIAQTAPKIKKNFEYDDLGNEFVRIHMEKQDFSKLNLLRRKAMKRKFPVEEKTEGDMEV